MHLVRRILWNQKVASRSPQLPTTPGAPIDSIRERLARIVQTRELEKMERGEIDVFSEQHNVMLLIQFNLHLIGRTVTNQAGNFKGKKQIIKSFWTSSFYFFGVGPTRRVVFNETEANPANLCLVVDCFRGEIHQSRKAGPRPQREARRPLAQRRPPRAPKQTTRPSPKQLFIPLCHPNHRSIDQVRTLFRSSFAVSASLLAAWGFGAAPAHPSDPKSDSFLSGASRTRLPLAAVL